MDPGYRGRVPLTGAACSVTRPGGGRHGIQADPVRHRRHRAGRRGAHVATGLANAGKAQLVVTHVWERPEGAEQVLQAALADAEAAGVKRLVGELHGGRSPADVLIELAASKDVGLIVVSGGRSSDGARADGGPSVSSRASRSADRDGRGPRRWRAPLPTGADRDRRLAHRRPGGTQGVRPGDGGRGAGDAGVRRPPRDRGAGDPGHDGDLRRAGCRPTSCCARASRRRRSWTLPTRSTPTSSWWATKGCKVPSASS